MLNIQSGNQGSILRKPLFSDQVATNTTQPSKRETVEKRTKTSKDDLPLSSKQQHPVDYYRQMSREDFLSLSMEEKREAFKICGDDIHSEVWGSIAKGAFPILKKMEESAQEEGLLPKTKVGPDSIHKVLEGTGELSLNALPVSGQVGVAAVSIGSGIVSKETRSSLGHAEELDEIAQKTAQNRADIGSIRENQERLTKEIAAYEKAQEKAKEELDEASEMEAKVKAEAKKLEMAGKIMNVAGEIANTIANFISTKQHRESQSRANINSVKAMAERYHSAMTKSPDTPQVSFEIPIEFLKSEIRDNDETLNRLRGLLTQLNGYAEQEKASV